MTIYLMVKIHNKTGLRYLCKTTQVDYKRYSGSGDDWKIHLKKYGNDITTEVIRECSTQSELREWGLYYSDLWNIVDGVDDFGNKIWANKIRESGGGPGQTPENARAQWTDTRIRKQTQDNMVKGWASRTPEEKEDWRIRNTGVNNPRYDPKVFVWHHSEHGIEICPKNTLQVKYNLPGPHLAMLCSRAIKTTKGWSLIY
jgi:hypothetical protein